MNADQVSQTRRTLRLMNDAADRAIDRHVTRSQAGRNDQVAATRRLLREMNDRADRAIDDQAQRR